MYRAHLSEENHSFALQMDSDIEEDIDIGHVELFEDDLEVDEFAETLEFIESNAEEIDAQVLDAITEASYSNITSLADY